MPQVPTLDETSAQPEQEQFAGIPTPPQGAFPGQVGASIEAVGAEIGRIAYEEQQKTHEVRAMEAETEYQNYLSDTVYDVNKGFSSIYGRSALEQAPVYKAAINAKREEIARRLNSRYAERLFNNNSLRTLRFAQDHVDAWAGAQRRTADDASYRLGFVIAARLASQFAASPVGYHPEAIDALIKEKQGDAYTRAAQLGMDEDTAHDFVSKSLSAVIDPLVKGFLVKDNPNRMHAKEVFEAYGDLMTPAAHDYAVKTLSDQGDADVVAGLLANIPRLNADKKLDPRAGYDNDTFRKALDKLPMTPVGLRQRAMAREAKQKDDDNVKDAGAQFENRIFRLGQGLGPNGEFAVPSTSPEWAEFSSLYPKLADALVDRAHNRQAKATAEGRASIRWASDGVTGRMLEELYESTHEQLTAMNPEGIATKMRAEYPDVRDKDITRVQDRLKTLQSGKGDALYSEIPRLADTVLRGASKNVRDPRAWRPRAIEFLDNLHAVQPGLSRDELMKALSTQTIKTGGFLGFGAKAPIEAADFPRPAIKPPQAQVKVLPGNVRIRDRDGVEYQIPRGELKAALADGAVEIKQ